METLTGEETYLLVAWLRVRRLPAVVVYIQYSSTFDAHGRELNLVFQQLHICQLTQQEI
jgi:hypothetical protein